MYTRVYLLTIKAGCLQKWRFSTAIVPARCTLLYALTTCSAVDVNVAFGRSPSASNRLTVATIKVEQTEHAADLCAAAEGNRKPGIIES